MKNTRHNLIQSIHISESGFSIQLRIERGKPQDIEQFLKDNDLADRIDLKEQVLDTQIFTPNIAA